MGYLPQYNQLDKQFPISVYEVVLAGLSKTKGLFPRYTQAQHQQVLDTLKRMQLTEFKTDTSLPSAAVSFSECSSPGPSYQSPMS